MVNYQKMVHLLRYVYNCWESLLGAWSPIYGSQDHCLWTLTLQKIKKVQRFIAMASILKFASLKPMDSHTYICFNSRCVKTCMERPLKICCVIFHTIFITCGTRFIYLARVCHPPFWFEWNIYFSPSHTFSETIPLPILPIPASLTLARAVHLTAPTASLESDRLA